MHFCPEWGLSINDRAQYPHVARAWLQGSILPRDHNFIKTMSNSALLQHYYLGSAQISLQSLHSDDFQLSSFFILLLFYDFVQVQVELAKHFENMSEVLTQDAATKTKLTAQLEAATAEVEALKKQLSQVHMNFQLEINKNSVLTTQLETEQKKSTELAGQCSATQEEGRRLGVRDFLRSDQFMVDLVILNTPILQHGYAQALNEVQALNLPRFDIGNFPNYNPRAVHQVDRLVEGYSRGYRPADLVANPMLPVTTPKPEQEEKGEN